MSTRIHFATAAAVTACAVVGSIASDPDGRWYRRLDELRDGTPGAPWRRNR